MNLNKNNIDNVLELLAQEYEVYVPGTKGDIKRYIPWQKGCADLEGDNTVLPPKDILFPKTEKMYSYKIGDPNVITELSEVPKRAIVGIRACDVHSIECMDKVFIQEGYTDTFYSNRRNAGLLVAISCPHASDNCFCDSMGLDPNNAPGADIMMTDGGDYYTVAANTEKGKAVLDSWKAFLEEGETAKSDTKCTLKADYREDLPKQLVANFKNDEIWNRYSKACLGCGTCSFICPTCYCFDVNLDKNGKEGTEFRCWDSCMFSDYNRIAGGINARPTKKERLRNRFLHKLSYFRERYDTCLCAGCGRCISKCPSHIDIAEFINYASEVCR